MSLDLFSPVVPAERFHPAFAKVVAGATDYDKAVLNRWAEGFVDRDRKIVKEFQISFDSSFWEIYLFAAFKELGMECDFQQSSPDFCVTSPKHFVVEATVSLNAQGAPSVPDANPLEYPSDHTDFNRQAIIRLLNSLDTKHKKYLKSYSRLKHVIGKPFVIAVAPFDRPHFQLQAQRAIEAVLYRSYVDEDAYLKEHPDSDVPLLAQDMPFVIKDSGESLPLGVFCNSGMSAVSAIIQSTAATWSKATAMGDDPDVMIDAFYENRTDGGLTAYSGPNSRYTESILDGLRVYHNPYAAIPLDPSLFERREIFQATSRGAVSVVPLYPATHNLACRTSTRILPTGTVARMFEGVPVDKSFWYRARR